MRQNLKQAATATAPAPVIKRCVVGTCVFNKVCRSCKISKSPHQRGLLGCANGPEWLDEIPKALAGNKDPKPSVYKAMAVAICSPHNELVETKLISLSKEFETLLAKDVDFFLLNNAAKNLLKELEAHQDALSLFQPFSLYLSDFIAFSTLEKQPNEELLEVSLKCLRLLTLECNSSSRLDADRLFEVLANLIHYLSQAERPKLTRALIAVIRNLSVGDDGSSAKRLQTFETGLCYALKNISAAPDEALGLCTSLCFLEKGKELLLRGAHLTGILMFLRENFKKLELRTQEKAVEFLAVAFSDEPEAAFLSKQGAAFGKIFCTLVEIITDHMAIFSEKVQYLVTNLQDKCRKL